MKMSMRATVDDLVRALRWHRSGLLDAVMVRKPIDEPLTDTRERALLRRAKLRRKDRAGAQTP